MPSSRNIFYALGLGIACISMTVFASEKPSFDWRPECVGRMQLELPGEVDIAALFPKDFKKEFEGGVPQPPYKFQDGESASWTYFAYGGRLLVTQALGKAEQANFMNMASQWRTEMDDVINVKHRKNRDGSLMQFESLPIKTQAGVAWRVDQVFTAYLEFGSYSLLWGISGEPIDMPRITRDYNNLIAGLTERQMFTVPTEQGVCLPHGFIKDDGSTDRNVAMTYRLKSHPDITIWLDDSSAGEYTEAIREKNARPEQQIGSFWRQYEFGPTAKLVGSIWEMPKMRSVKLGGQSGLASFVKIKRKDDSIDYGYLAVVRGDPKAKQDTPDLQLYVIREAAKAKAKGVAPIGEKEFLELAQAIAAGVKHRPNGQN